MIDRYLIRYFLAVVDQGGFSRAAAACRVSQPTLSVGIAKLERAIGEPLFNRSNRRVELTEVGARFVDHARRIETAFTGAEGVNRQSEARPLLRLAVLSSLPGAWLEDAIAAARLAAPDERLEIVEVAQKDISALLGRGRVDAAIGLVDGAERSRRTLFQESYALALALDHRLADQDVLRAEDLAGETMIVRRHCEALSETSRYFTRRGVRPFMAARTVSDDRALTYVRTGLGVTVMPTGFRDGSFAMAGLAGFDQQRTIGVLVDPDSVRRVESMISLTAFADAYEQASVAVSGVGNAARRDF